jgi:hypothetical protein
MILMNMPFHKRRERRDKKMIEMVNKKDVQGYWLMREIYA